MLRNVVLPIEYYGDRLSTVSGGRSNSVQVAYTPRDEIPADLDADGLGDSEWILALFIIFRGLFHSSPCRGRLISIHSPILSHACIFFITYASTPSSFLEECRFSKTESFQPLQYSIPDPFSAGGNKIYNGHWFLQKAGPHLM